MKKEYESEREYIAYLLNNQKYISEMEIKPFYLLNEENANMLDAIVRCYEKLGIVSLVEINETNDTVDINDLVNVWHKEYFAGKDKTHQKVYEEYILKEYKNKVINDLHKDKDNKKITLDEYLTKMETINKINLSQEVGSLTIEELTNNIKGGKRIHLEKLDKMSKLLRLVQNDFVVVGGLTGSGKSSFLINLALDLSKNYKILYFNLEMADYTINQRFIGLEAGIPIFDVETPKSKEQQQKINLAIESLASKNITINHTSNNIEDIKRIVAGVKDPRHKIVFIDHIGLTRSGDSKKSLYEQATEVAKTLRQISLTYDCTIISASQFNRGAVGSERIGLHHLKDSGEIENSASKVLIMQKQEDIQELEALVEVDIAKNRDGGIGMRELMFRKQFQRFEETE